MPKLFTLWRPSDRVTFSFIVLLAITGYTIIYMANMAIDIRAARVQADNVMVTSVGAFDTKVDCTFFDGYRTMANYSYYNNSTTSSEHLQNNNYNKSRSPMDLFVCGSIRHEPQKAVFFTTTYYDEHPLKVKNTNCFFKFRDDSIGTDVWSVICYDIAVDICCPFITLCHLWPLI